MGWLDKVKRVKQNERDKWQRKFDLKREKERAKEGKAAAAVSPALVPYRQIVEEFCAETEWSTHGEWTGEAGHKRLQIRSATRNHAHAGTSFEYHDKGWIAVTSPPLRTSVYAKKEYTYKWAQKFDWEFRGISERRLKNALRAFYQWY